MWALGESLAADKKTIDAVKLPFMKGFNSQHMTARHSKMASYIILESPESLALIDGYEARKKYLPEDQVSRTKQQVRDMVSEPVKDLMFGGTIAIWPKLNKDGRVNEKADPVDLEDVRIVLQIGDKIYQPKVQPGKLAVTAGTGVNPFDARGRGTSYTTKTLPNGTIQTTPTYGVTTTRQNEDFDYYEGPFSADFDLFNPDGTPRVGPQDKTITVIVVFGKNEEKIPFDLTELDHFHH
jgi:hypothetical protein